MKLAPLVSHDPRVTVGRYSYGSPQFRLWGESETIEIGSFCSISDNVTIFGGGEHNSHWITTYPMRIAFGLPGAGHDGHPKSKGPTVIGSDVWVGYGAIILSGVAVGHGAVIGAGSVLAVDVPPYAVAVGNPARVVRYRFSGEIIERLLSIRWWDWPIETILEHVNILCSGNIDGLFDLSGSRNRRE